MNSSNEIADEYRVKKHRRFSLKSGDDPSEPFMPEKRLWLAVLLDAVFELGKVHDPDRLHPNYKKRRNVWLYGGNSYIGSLSWICDVLDLDINQVRKLKGVKYDRAGLFGARA